MTNKHIYKAKEDDEKYKDKLVNSRQGINLTEAEAVELSEFVIPAIKKRSFSSCDFNEQ